MKRLVSTLGMPHEEWLKYRKMGIGGSDAGAICGLNPYSSPVTVYMDKTSETTDLADNEAMRQGRDLEEYVAKRFCEATGKKVRRANAVDYYSKQNHIFNCIYDNRMLKKYLKESGVIKLFRESGIDRTTGKRPGKGGDARRYLRIIKDKFDEVNG